MSFEGSVSDQPVCQPGSEPRTTFNTLGENRSAEALNKQPITDDVPNISVSSEGPPPSQNNLDDFLPLQYTPLRAPNIRLISIDHSNGNGMLRCTLQEAPLTEDLRFHALSYVWGDSKDTQTILVNGQRLEVTQNLFDFLDTARQHEFKFLKCHSDPGAPLSWYSMKDSYGPAGPAATPMLWWADAISINQTDTAEKNEQVPRMGDIYAMATRVWIWFGLPQTVFRVDHDFWELKRALAFLRKDEHAETPRPLVAQFERHRKDDFARRMVALARVAAMPKGSPEMEAILAEFDAGPPPDDPNSFHKFLRQLAEVLSQSYCKRTWIIQEFILNAATPIALLGNFPFTLEDLLGLILRLLNERNRMNEQFVGHIDSMSMHMVHLLNLVSTRRQWHGGNRTAVDFRRLPLGHKLGWLLRKFVLRKSSVPHDYFYGVLGLLRQHELPKSLLPDYNLSFEEVSMEYTKYILESTGDLRIIETHAGELQNCPSWVPDVRHFSLNLEEEVPETKSAMSFSADGQRMTVEGAPIGGIITCSCTACPSEYSDKHLEFINDVLIEGSAEITGRPTEDVFTEWLRNLLEVELMLPRSLMSDYGSMKELLQKYHDICSDIPEYAMEALSKLPTGQFHEIYRTPCKDPGFLSACLRLARCRYALLETGEILVCGLRNTDLGARHRWDDQVWTVKGFDQLAILRPAEKGYEYCGPCKDLRRMKVRELPLSAEAGTADANEDIFASRTVQEVTLV